MIFAGHRLRSIENYQHQIGIRQSFDGFPNADRFRFVERLTNARRIDELNRNATDGHGFAHQVPRSARSCRNDGTFALDQPIEQTRLADIRPADDGKRQSLMNDFSVGEAGGKLLQWQTHRRNALEDDRVLHNRHVVLGEVDSSLEHGDQFDQFLFDRLQSPGKRAFELLRGDLSLVQRLRVDQVADRLGLRQIDAAIQKSAHGEFPRLREPRPGGDAKLDNVAKYHRRTVGRDFNDVVCRVRMRLGKIGYDHFVDTCREQLPLRPARCWVPSCSTERSSASSPPGSMSSPKTARPGSMSCFSLRNGLAISSARGPASRTTPIPPRPGGVAMATIVSSTFTGRL